MGRSNKLLTSFRQANTNGIAVFLVSSGREPYAQRQNLRVESATLQIFDGWKWIDLVRVLKNGDAREWLRFAAHSEIVKNNWIRPVAGNKMDNSSAQAAVE